ncbi:MAG TPA: cell division topological specificity factor MinE [Bradyrhizobium sp.]|uniref:cell division topological specificity factor MinE n=1 Tax=Bradyrhizobium sp. TaxID=376 RepID=UPI002D7EEA63|nr:cell division topological specificity factor MinE [Bradyrhizobium sp.]HET7886952.1 cell division topological specificity factor MinE [Bradyrhizobium sp.]
MMGLRLFGGGRAAPVATVASAPVARERLQILLAHERGMRGQPDLLELLRTEILAVVSRHVSFDPEKLQIKMDRGHLVSMLEIDIEVPNEARPAAVA